MSHTFMDDSNRFNLSVRNGFMFLHPSIIVFFYHPARLMILESVYHQKYNVNIKIRYIYIYIYIYCKLPLHLFLFFFFCHSKVLICIHHNHHYRHYLNHSIKEQHETVLVIRDNKKIRHKFECSTKNTVHPQG